MESEIEIKMQAAMEKAEKKNKEAASTSFIARMLG
jgi:hypothetical protein